MSSLWPASESRHAGTGAREVVFSPDNSDRPGRFPERDSYGYFFREVVVHNEIVAEAEKLAAGADVKPAEVRPGPVSREPPVSGEVAATLRERLRRAGREVDLLLAALEGKLAGMPGDAGTEPYVARTRDLRENRDRVATLLRLLPDDRAST